MAWKNPLRFMVVFTLATNVALSVNVKLLTIEKTSKEWADSAQKTILEVSQIFDRASFGLSTFTTEKNPLLTKISQSATKVAGVFGIFGALFSILLTFIPRTTSDSPELKMMRTEFHKLSQKIDTIARSVDDTKDLIKLSTQMSAFIEHEEKIQNGFAQLKECLDKLANAK